MKKMVLILSCLFGVALQCSLFAEGVDTPPVREQSLWQMLIMIAIFLVFFYFILFRPEQKRRKAAETQRSSLKKGDRVTAMGILGTVVRVEDQTVILKMVDGSKIEVLKGIINDVMPGTEEDEKKVAKIDKGNTKSAETIEG